MKPIDFELERARRALDGPEAYPGELIETVIVGLVGDMQRAGVESAGRSVRCWSICVRGSRRASLSVNGARRALSSNELCSRIVRSPSARTGLEYSMSKVLVAAASFALSDNR